MSVYPLYASEVEDVRRLGPEHARDAFEKKGINLSDPDRPAANLSRQKGSARKRVSGPKHASGSVRSVRQSWKAIETWYSKHVPEMFKGLKPGASEDDIEAYAKQLKVDLPRDYIESLKLHDGETDLGEWTYLSIEAALENWRRKQGLLRKQQPGASQRVKGRGDGKMQEVWWDPAWIPFAEDSGGNLLCLDLHPDIDGTVGQVLDIDMEDGPSLTEYDSFAEWLESFWHDLKANAYKIDRSGWLVPR
jgi:cell wall assembly regulator SMI1